MSKELQAWMAKWCREAAGYDVAMRCRHLLKQVQYRWDKYDSCDCPPEGRPDCPALREMPKPDDLMHRTWNEGSNWSRERAEMPREERPR